VRAALAILAAALLLAGCGGSDEEPPGDAATTPGADTATATAPAAPAEEVGPVETVTETIPAPPPVTSPAPTPTQPEDAPGGAGDEGGIAVQTRFVLGADGSVSPQSAEVPAFLGTAVIVENADDRAHRLEVGDRGASLPAGRTTSLSLPGRAPTELPVLIDGNQAATLRVVAERP
jgi:hypothetical protein